MSEPGPSDARDALPPASTSDPLTGPRAELAKVIPRRPRVSWWLGIGLAIAFAFVVVPSITANRWLGTISKIERGKAAPFSVRVPPFAGYDTATGHTGGGGVLVARGEVPDRDTALAAHQIDAAMPHGTVPYIAYFLLVVVLAGLFTHHMRRSTQGRLLRVQLFSLALIAVAAVAVKLVMLMTALSVLVVPVALFAMVPTLVFDRVVGLATGTLTALVVSLLVPFDVGVAVMLLVQAGAAGLVIAERPKKRLRAVVTAGVAVTLFTAATYPLMLYLTAGKLPLDELNDPLHSAWLASALGPALATAVTLVCVPLYQLLVGEITQNQLVELEDLSNPLLKQIASKAPGTWQHSLMMANMAEIAANAIGANGRLVRVGAYYHDLGKSLQPKYFIENLEPGETSPHDKLPPEVSCDAIFAHVTEGILAARRAGLHERIIDFMHMHHGNGVLEYFWGKTNEQGNPKKLTVEHFRYPGVPPQSRETAILSICDAVEAASRTLKKPEVKAIDNLVQRIVYGKLHLGQLDESGLSMGDLRRLAESLRETIRHANHGRIEYPWQKAEQDASASSPQSQTAPRLDSLDRPANPDTVAAANHAIDSARISADALAKTDDAGATPKLRPQPRDSSELATKTTAPVARPVLDGEEKPTTQYEKSTTKYERSEPDEVVELRATKPKIEDARAIGPTAPADSVDQLAAKRPSDESIVFATEAKTALDAAAKDLPGARKKAATLPPLKPPTAPPPLVGLRPPGPPPAPNVTVPPPDSLRPPAKNLLDDMITLQPQYELRPGIAVEKSEDGSITMQPTKPPRALEVNDAVRTNPHIRIDDVDVPEGADAAVTNPGIVLPLRAPVSEPAIPVAPVEAAVAGEPSDEEKAASSWARGLAARLEKQLEADFGTETPVVAPTKAELQMLLNLPPDVTKQQSIEDLERLHQEARERPSEESLDFTRRAPYPTREVDDADIEAAIELAPPARRNVMGNVIGVMKKPPPKE